MKKYGRHTIEKQIIIRIKKNDILFFESNPQLDLNLLSDLNRGDSHCLQAYVPFSKWLSYIPVNGASVPLFRITSFSSNVSFLNFTFIFFTNVIQICMTRNY